MDQGDQERAHAAIADKQYLLIMTDNRKDRHRRQRQVQPASGLSKTRVGRCGSLGALESGLGQWHADTGDVPGSSSRRETVRSEVHEAMEREALSEKPKSEHDS